MNEIQTHVGTQKVAFIWYEIGKCLFAGYSSSCAICLILNLVGWILGSGQDMWEVQSGHTPLAWRHDSWGAGSLLVSTLTWFVAAQQRLIIANSLIWWIHQFLPTYLTNQEISFHNQSWNGNDNDNDNGYWLWKGQWHWQWSSIMIVVIIVSGWSWSWSWW